jgi:hypothetical protein
VATTTFFFFSKRSHTSSTKYKKIKYKIKKGEERSHATANSQLFKVYFYITGGGGGGGGNKRDIWKL